MRFRCFFLLSRRLLLDFLYLLSSDKSYSLDDGSDKLGSESGSSGTYSFCAFYFRFGDSVGSVSVLVSAIFSPRGVESKGDIFAFDVFVPTGVESKDGQLIKTIWRSNSIFFPLI